MKQRMAQFLILILAFTLAVGCTRKRDKVVQQGQHRLQGQTKDKYHLSSQVVDPDRLQKEKIPGIIVLTTGKVVTEVPRSSAQEFFDETSGESFKNYPIVSYEVDYPKDMPNIVGDNVRFRGAPGGYKYQILTHFEHDQLWISKVAKLEALPTDELTFASQIKEGIYSVPLATCPVNFFKEGLSRNADNEKTNVIYYEAVRRFEESSHLDIELDSCKSAEPILKADVFKADYFEGEWFFARTVIQAQNDSLEKDNQGYSINSRDVTLEPASRVIFYKTPKGFHVLNTSVDKRIIESTKSADPSVRSDLDPNVELQFVMSMPAEFHDYRVKANNQGVREAKEESYKERNYSEKEWIKIDFGAADEVSQEEQAIIGGLSDGRDLLELQAILESSVGKETRALADLRVADDFFSFSQLQPDMKAKVRYSFRRVKGAITEGYKGRRAIWDDLDHFGIFWTEQPVIKNHELTIEEDEEKFRHLQIFHPSTKMIRFHMSHQMAQSDFARDLALEAVDYWDKAFKLAGTNIRVSLEQDKSKSVDLGDIRYNVLHIIDRISSGLSGGGILFGTGPSISNPETGEVISVSNSLHIDSFRLKATQYIKQYLILRSELTAGALRGIRNNFTLGGGGSAESTERAEFGFGYGSLAGFEVFAGNNEKGKMTFEPLRVPTLTRGTLNEFEYKSVERENFTSSHLHSPRSEQFLNTDGRNQFRKIAAFCPEVAELVKTVKAAGRLLPADQMNPAILSCANKLIRPMALGTLVHELGHNFGLIHNYKGSVDSHNFWTKKELLDEFGVDMDAELLSEDFRKSSSIMDYLPMNRDQLFVPGRYDIAALRYAYKGQVLGSNGKPKPIEDQTVSLERNFGKQLDGLKRFEYCADFEARASGNYDALCRKFDLGTTPDEIADFYITNYFDSLKNSTFRLDRLSGGPGAVSASRFTRNIIPLKRLYDQWRFHLADFVGDKNKYLSGFTAEQYEGVLQAMSQANQKADEIFEGIEGVYSQQKTHQEIYEEWEPVRRKYLQFLSEIIFLPNHYCLGADADGQVRAKEMEELLEDIRRASTIEYVESCEDPAILAVLEKMHGIEYISEVGFPFKNRKFSLRLEDDKDGQLDTGQHFDVYGTELDKSLAAMAVSKRMRLGPQKKKNLYPSPMDEPDFRDQMVSQYLERTQAGVNFGPILEKKINGLDKENDPVAESLAKVLDETEPQNLYLNKFLQEGEYLGELYGHILLGQIVPSDQYETNLRLAAFSGRPETNPAIYGQRGMVSTKLPGSDVHIMATPENPIVASYIQMFEAVNIQVSPMIQNIAENDFEMATQILRQLMPLMPQEQAALKGVHLLQLIQGIPQSKTPGLSSYLAANEITPQAKAILQELFASELMLFGQSAGPVINALSNEQARAQLPPERLQMLEQSMAEFADTEISSDYEGMPSAPLNVAGMEKRMSDAIASIGRMIRDREELEAKRNLILGIIQN